MEEKYPPAGGLWLLSFTVTFIVLECVFLLCANAQFRFFKCGHRVFKPFARTYGSNPFGNGNWRIVEAADMDILR